MSKNTVCDLAVGFIEKYGYFALAIVLAITLIFAGHFRFDSFASTTDPVELARLMTSIAFPMTAIMIFVSGQSLGLRQKYLNKTDYMAKVYAKISVTSTVALIGSAITGLLSLQYFKSGGDTLLVIALYLFLSIIVLLIVNTVFFTIYALGKTAKQGID